MMLNKKYVTFSIFQVLLLSLLRAHSSLSSSMLSCNILLQRYMKRYCSIAYDFKL